MNQASAIIDRYPGPRPFDEKEKFLFFGRNMEIEELSQSINVHNLFVFHADSGLGKSSLINAGLIPRLREKDYYPIVIRFKNFREETPVSYVLGELKNIMAERNVAEGETDHSTIWYWVKLYNRKGIIPVLIFDQFEEFAYFRPQERKELANELACLLVSSIPNYIKEKTKEAREQSDNFSWFTQPEVKILFSLRSDRLNVFQEFTDPIPSILRNCFQLKSLNGEQARNTIVLPALMESCGPIQFSSMHFSYSEELVSDIMDVARDDKSSAIETTHLQMICQEIEGIVKKNDLKEHVEITSDDLGGKKGLEDLVKNFYNKQLKKISGDPKISGAEYGAICVLIEKKLLIQEKRIPLAEDTVFQHFREQMEQKTGEVIPDEKIRKIVDTLVSLRLVRNQNYGSSVFYEIGHDTLIAPIVGEMKKREEEEKKLQEDKAKEDIRKEYELQSLKEKAAKAKRLTIYVIVLVILLIGLIVTIYRANVLFMEMKFARTADLIAGQNFIEAKNTISAKSIFRLFDYQYDNTIKKWKDTITILENKNKVAYDHIRKGDSLLKIANAKFETVTSVLEENNASPTKASKADVDRILNEIYGEKIIEACLAYKAARDSIFYSNTNFIAINDTATASLETKLNKGKAAYPRFFIQSIDAIYFLVQARQENPAEEVYKVATKLKSFAENNDIQLDSIDIVDFDRLTSKLKK